MSREWTPEDDDLAQEFIMSPIVGANDEHEESDYYAWKAKLTQSAKQAVSAWLKRAGVKGVR